MSRLRSEPHWKDSTSAEALKVLKHLQLITLEFNLCYEEEVI